MFEGFSDATVDFMWGIRFNNEKGWFEAHKEDYLTHFQRPMRELADEVYAYMADRYPQYGLFRKITRIYRDARRLHGRGPYKDHLWFSIEKPSEQWTATPVFWFELMPEGASWGLGYYGAKPLTMAKLRARMDKDPAPMEALTRRLESRTDLVLEGESYRRPKGESPSPLLLPWYQKKSFSISHEEPISAALYTHDLVHRLCVDFDFLVPFYDYFVTLDGDPDPRDG